jgi:hypothetical protein
LVCKSTLVFGGSVLYPCWLQPRPMPTRQHAASDSRLMPLKVDPAPPSCEGGHTTPWQEDLPQKSQPTWPPPNKLTSSQIVCLPRGLHATYGQRPLAVVVPQRTDKGPCWSKYHTD